MVLAIGLRSAPSCDAGYSMYCFFSGRITITGWPGRANVTEFPIAGIAVSKRQFSPDFPTLPV
jgi:hypothetical protein